MNTKTEKKAPGKRKTIIVAAAAIIIAAAAAGMIIINTSAQSADASQSSYREYTVAKGDITVGAEESGTLSIERAYMTLPCSAEVSEVYVREGVTVSEGDPLMMLSADDLSDAENELKSAVSSAELSLNKAKTDRDIKLLEAQHTMESTLENGKNAESEYDIFAAQNEVSKQNLADQLAKLKAELEEYEEMSRTYPDDYKILSEYETKLDEYDAKYKEMEKKYKELAKIDSTNAENTQNEQDKYDEYIESISDSTEKIEELKQAYETAKEKYDKSVEAYQEAKTNYENAANLSSDGESKTEDLSSKLSEAEKAMKAAYLEYNSANVAYSSYYRGLDEKISDKVTEFEDNIAELKKIQKAHEKETAAYKSEMDDYEDEISPYREEYEEFKSDFTDTYGQNDEDSISEKISDLKKSITETELTIEENAASESSKLLQARQQAQSAAAESDSAEAVYDQTVAALDNDVEKAEKEYNTAVQEYDDFKESISEDGILKASCSGIISSVSVSEGSSTQPNMTLVTIMDTKYIYLSASVSEEDVTSLYVGQACSVSLTAYENKSFEGTIHTISAEPARSSGSVTYTVTVKLTDESGLNVREGMTGEITFLQKQVTDVCYVNVNAITFRDGASYVKVYDENGNIIEQQVVTGFTDGRYVEIISGLSAGDKVLAEIELAGNGQRG
ncbi:MAG: efflux RND transporter periplasmic adaptor subunit [Huintestinicola sp.]